jgi:predicted phage-related endonuclease
MKKCGAFELCVVTGTNVCCKGCEQLSTCGSACEDAFDLTRTCPDEIEPETKLQVFQREQIQVIQNMVDLLKAKKQLEETEKSVRSKLTEAMNAYGVKSFEGNGLKVTFVAPTTKTSVDSKKLKKEHPDVYRECSKISNVSASVRISLL